MIKTEAGKWIITIIVVATFPLWVIPVVILAGLCVACFEMHELLWDSGTETRD